MSEQTKFRILKTIQPTQQYQTTWPTQRSDTSNERLTRIERDSLPNLKSSQPYSNISYRYSQKHKPLSQGIFYGSPLLAQNQLEIIDKMKCQARNDFYGQLKSFDPYQYPTRLQDLYISPKSLREPTVEVHIHNELKEPYLQLGNFSSNLSKHNPRDKIHRGIPQKHDIKSLAIWVDLMVQQIIEKYSDQKQIDFYEEVQNVLTLCLKELIRQISIDCIERSVLLEKIWTQYVEINSTVINQVVNEKKENEKQNLKQIMKTHQLYQYEIDNFQLIISNQKEEQTKLTDKLIRLKDNGKYLKKTNKNLQNTIRELKFQLNDYTTSNKYLLNEIQNLKQQIQENEIDIHNFQQSSQANCRASSPQNSDHSPLQFPQPIKVIQASAHKSFNIQIEEQLKNALKSDSETTLSNFEDMLINQSTDTNDLIILMNLQKDQSTQTIASNIQPEHKSILLPDLRHNVVQTDYSISNFMEKEIQTELPTEILEEIKTEEDQLIQFQEQFIKTQENYKQLLEGDQINSPDLKQISSFLLSLGDVSSKMKQAVQHQREYRTSLLLINSAQQDENQRKNNELQQLKINHDNLQLNLESAKNEIIELENHLELQEQINSKLERKYNKIKDKKQQLIEKTTNLINQLTKTQQFTNIMKKKIQEKKTNNFGQKKQPATQSQSQLPSSIEISQNFQQQFLLSNNPSNQQQYLIASSPGRQQLNTNRKQNKPENSSNTIIQQEISNQQISVPKKKWNIQITNTEEQQKESDNESDRSLSQISFQQSISIAQDDIISQRSFASNRRSSQIQSQAKSPGNHQLNTNNGNNRQGLKSAKKSIPTQNNLNIESVKMISDTLKKFLNEELDNSVASSIDSSFSSKMEAYSKRKSDRQQKKRNITQTQAPKFQNRNNAESTSQLNFQRSKYLVTFLAERFAKNPKLATPKMQRINVLKFVSQFYCEKIKQYSNKNTPLHQICYEHFVNTYGFKSMAEQKLTNFYQSIYFYRENFRINLFGRFLELLSPLTLDDLEIYIQSLKILDENEIALHMASIVNEKGVLVTLDKAIASLDMQHQCLSIEIKDKIIKDIRLNTYERKNKICVDVDFFISKLLNGYHQYKLSHQAHFEEVFYSADMDMDGMIEFQEFQKLYLHFEINQGTKSNKKLIRTQFMERCDTISNESGEKAMSFDRFVTFSLENNIFSEEKFSKFSKNVDFNDPIKNLNDLKDNWINIQQLLISRIDFSEPNEGDYYQNIIQKLDQALKTKELKECYWISYRILDADTKALYLSKIAADLIPEDLLYIQEQMNEIFDDNIENE
ncbi:unnamed protein product [Paramecium pentaurelia]|uniref:EF-hand domain-containing protein n=1 Tax=Paramecium pentaurelia TaxID=43138 RepID=A0A8S1YE50_9CILI|nr:unnamed protein product [Paramecium pentaurelia]